MEFFGLTLKDLDPLDGSIEEAVTVHYNRFNQQGLKMVSNYFKKKGFEVDELDVDDKLKKKDGIPTKAVKFRFKNGQTTFITFAFIATARTKIDKTFGAMYEAKVDGKKVPITFEKGKKKVLKDSLDKLVGFLKKSSPKIPKVKKDVALSDLESSKKQKKPNKSAMAKLKEMRARKEELLGVQSDLDKNIAFEKKEKEKLVKINTKLNDQLAELENDISQLEKGVA